MNDVKLSPISNRETYIETFQAMDETGTVIDLEAAGASIVCEMREAGCTSTTELTVAIDADTFTASLTETQTRGLNLGEYEIGCTIEMDDVVTQFFVGTIQVVDGIVA